MAFPYGVLCSADKCYAYIGGYGQLLFYLSPYLLNAFEAIYMVFIAIFTDIDECTETINGCEQICTDTEGSFVCSCKVGYHLAVDGRSCGGIYFLLDSTQTTVHRLYGLYYLFDA